MALNERKPASATSLYQRARFSLTALLIERLLKMALRCRERQYASSGQNTAQTSLPSDAAEAFISQTI